MPRLFTGLEIPAEIGQTLSSLRGGLPGARWVDPENYHVTLRFIGDIDGVSANEIASMLFQVKDRSRPLTVAYSGGTAFNFVNDVPHFDTYIYTQRKMAGLAAGLNASVIMSNHSEFDNAVTKIRLLAARKAGESHPFELGREAVQRYFKVMDECAQAARLKLM